MRQKALKAQNRLILEGRGRHGGASESAESTELTDESGGTGASGGCNKRLLGRKRPECDDFCGAAIEGRRFALRIEGVFALGYGKGRFSARNRRSAFSERG